jgi:hypothetical protein
MLTPNEAYQYDPVFRRVVDLMCAYLSEYQITPSELRQAAILAATLHENRRIKPLYVAKPHLAMFGGYKYNLDDTATGAMLGCASGRIQSTVPNFTEQDKQAGLEQDYNMMLKYNCICGYKGSNKALHTHTCQDYNWDVTHPKPEHCHIFVGTGHDYSVCNDCGMSDVYYNWAYNKKQPLPKIVSDTEGWRDDY